MDKPDTAAYLTDMTSESAVRLFDRTTPPHIVTLVLLAGIGAMNMSAFLPALPEMTQYFNTDYAIMQLSVSLYLAATAILQLLIGPISDRYGRRPVTMICIAIFLLATLGCLMAQTVELFLFFRLVQAAVAVGLALSRAIVRDMFEQDQAASKIGYVTMGMALVPMVAPMIGGALNEAFGWHSIFFFLLVAGAAVGVLAFFDQGETVRGKPTSFAAQLRDYPELFASPRFWGYCMSAAFASGAFFAFLGGAPYVASEVYGLNSFWAGVGFGAPAIGYAFGNFLSGRYAVRFGIKPMIFWGSLITMSGLMISMIVTGSGYGSAFTFFAFCTSVGIGNGMVMPNASAGMLSVRPHLAGTASGLGGAIMIGGGAALSVLAGILLKLGTTSLPLQALMCASAVLAFLSVLYVIRREKQLERVSA